MYTINGCCNAHSMDIVALFTYACSRGTIGWFSSGILWFPVIRFPIPSILLIFNVCGCWFFWVVWFLELNSSYFADMFPHPVWVGSHILGKRSFSWMNPHNFSFWSRMNYGNSITVFGHSGASKMAVAYAEDLINEKSPLSIWFLSKVFQLQCPHFFCLL